MAYFFNQPVVPAVRNLKDFEDLMTRQFTYLVLLESHLAQLPGLMKLARENQKKVIVHADLVQGLKHDEAATQFLCQVLRPAGVISTHSTVLSTAKRSGTLAIQRVFLIDSHSLDTSLRVLGHAKPDYIEVLPGVLPNVIQEVARRTTVPILAGGFIRTRKDIQTTLEAGATAVTTSHRDLWSDPGR